MQIVRSQILSMTLEDKMASTCYKHAHKVLKTVPQIFQKELHLAAFLIRRGKYNI